MIYVWHIILWANKQLLGDNHVIEMNAVLIQFDFFWKNKIKGKIKYKVYAYKTHTYKQTLCLFKCEDE